MSAIILARPRPEFFGQSRQVIHAFVTGQHHACDRRQALCGFSAPATLLVPVAEISCMGCELCLAALPTDLLSGDATNAHLPPSPPPSADGTSYAIGLRGERVRHRLAPNPVTTQFEGRDAVLCACGVIGFLAHGQPRTGYQTCPQCHLIWRQSGLDAHSHAYPAEGRFIPSGVSYAPELGAVEYRVPICGYAHPAAFVMPHGSGEPRDACVQLVEPFPYLVGTVSLPTKSATGELHTIN